MSVDPLCKNKSQVDLGCGSGSLLEALLREPTTLEHMIGIDISRKALIRGAKVWIYLAAWWFIIVLYFTSYVSNFDFYISDQFYLL